MTDPNDNTDLEGLARGDYFDPNNEAGLASDPPAGDPDLDGAGDPPGAAAPDADADPAAEPADADADAGADAGAKAVPYGRFKDVVDQKNGAQARILELEALLAAGKPAPAAAAPEAPVSKVDTLLAARAPLYAQAEEARLDGEVELAAKLQQQIDDINADILMAKSAAVSRQTVAVDREAQQYEAFIDHLEATYPQFRADAPEYDRALVVDINETAEAYEARGMTPTAAMQRTVKLFSARLAGAAAPAAPAAPKPNVSKSVAAMKSQPADMSGAGANRDDVKINAATLSDEEYDKLPESTRAKLRGDFAT